MSANSQFMSNSEIAAAALMGVLLLLIVLYVVWNTVIRHRKVTRVADRDEDAVNSKKDYTRYRSGRCGTIR